jgi:YidC/Oxa1 family membrane protein insertase
MAAMQTLNPPPPDPMQQKIFAFMPWVFMFILGKFAAGLLIYWCWNNVLSFAQQYVIMRRQGVETPIGSFISKRYVALRARLTAGGASGGGGTPEGGA